jgi:hypothetical protein
MISNRISGKSPSTLDAADVVPARTFVKWLHARGVKPIEVERAAGVAASAVSKWFLWGGVPSKRSYRQLQKTTYFQEYLKDGNK